MTDFWDLPPGDDPFFQAIDYARNRAKEVNGQGGAPAPSGGATQPPKSGATGGGAGGGGTGGGGIAGGQRAPTVGIGTGQFGNYDLMHGDSAPFVSAGDPNLPLPGNGSFAYANKLAYEDPNSKNIYDVIGNQINNLANTKAAVAGRTTLGSSFGYGGANIGPISAAAMASISPQMMVDSANLNTAQDQQYAAAQNAAINQAYAQSQGYGPSVAEQQARMQSEQGIKAQMAMLGSQRGASNTATALRQAANQGAAMQQQAAQTGALGRSQEAMNAQQQLAGLLGGARGQSQNTAQTQAQLAQQALLSNQGSFNQAALQQAQMAQQSGQFNATNYNQQALQQAQMMQQAGLANQQYANQFMLQQGQMDQGTALANLQAQQQRDQLNAQLYQQGLQAYMTQNQQDIANAQAYQNIIGSEQQNILALNAGKDIAGFQQGTTMAGAGMSALAGLAMLSDIRTKKNIRSGEAELRELLRGAR